MPDKEKRDSKRRSTEGKLSPRRRGASAGSEMSSELITLQPGPRKTRPKGPAQPRITTHKSRSVWFQARASWPVRDAPIRRLVAARLHALRSAQASVTEEWGNVGPVNIGGRTTSLVCHPTNTEVVWVGAAGGGVWQTSDGGATWATNWHSQDCLNIGSLALDPKNPDILYCGTGEANLSADSYPGVGLFRSTDGGATWHVIAAPDATGIPRRIGAIAVDPFDSNHLKLGGVGYNEVSSSGSDFGGLYTSHDGGITWQRESFVSTGNYWSHAVVFHPATKGTVYATITEQGSKNGIWRSTDSGVSWKQLTTGLPDPSSIGRTSLAISPSSPKVLYAISRDENSSTADRVLGVFRSADGGNSWANIAGTEFTKETQMSYGNTIAVHPADPNTAICGGVDLHRTTDGGKTWTQITHWDANRGDADYAHADHHAVVMPASNPGSVYSANDGGVDMSKDSGSNWENLSNGLAVTMFYDIDVAASDAGNFGGGAQDNGTIVTATGSAGDYMQILGGDGGWMVYDPQDARHLYASYYNMGIYRFKGGAPTNVSPPVPTAERAAIWMCFITMDPSAAATVYTGSNRLWRTTDDGKTWKPISSSFDNSAITAIEVAPADSKRIYIGTENGGFFRSTDGGKTWSANLSSSVLPGNTITRLETSADSGADFLLATIANFGHSHVFCSRDGGVTWEDFDKGQLPDVPHHAILISPSDANTVYVCNDVGVFVSNDAAKTWSNMTLNLPNVMVIDLVYHVSDGFLYAATYGRSIWRIRIDN